MRRFILAFAILFISFSLNAQEVRKTMKFQGYEREYYLYMPQNLHPGRPLVFMLHGHGGEAKTFYHEFIRHQYVGGIDDKDVVLYEVVDGVHCTGMEYMPLGDTLAEFFLKYMTL